MAEKAKAEKIKPEELAKIDHRPPLSQGWMQTPVQIKSGIFCYAGKPANLQYLGLPNPREWAVPDEDWKLPPIGSRSSWRG